MFASLQPQTLGTVDVIACGNVFRTGKAKQEVTQIEVQERTIDFPCCSVLNLSVNAAGKVAPCCAGLDQSALSFGNVKQKSIAEVVKLMNSSQIARILAFFGTSFFLPILERAGINIGKKEDFTTACELCSAIFSHPSHIEVIENYLKELKKRSVLEAINYLKRETATLEETTRIA